MSEAHSNPQAPNVPQAACNQHTRYTPNTPQAPSVPHAPRVPELIDIEQVSKGWVNKYLLHYRKPDGSPYTYESVSRKKLDEYRKELMHNATGNSSNQGTSEPRDQSTQNPQGQSACASPSQSACDSPGQSTCNSPSQCTCDSPSQSTCDSPGQSAFCDGVCIVPELPDGSYLLIKEFRYPLNAFCAAFPAGLIDPEKLPKPPSIANYKKKPATAYAPKKRMRFACSRRRGSPPRA